MLSRKIKASLCLVVIVVACLLLISGCSDGSSSGAENEAEEVQESESAEGDAESSASYATLTISTYDVDTSGDQELIGTESRDAEGNVLDVYEKGSSEVLGDYEYTLSYAYNSDGLVSEFTQEYIDTNLHVSSVTEDFEYQYDTGGNLTEIHCTVTDTYSDESWATGNVVAVLSYNTEGNVSSVGIYTVSSLSHDEDGSEENYDTGYTSDLFYGVTVDFTYYFDEITEISISVGFSEDGVVTLDQEDDTVYSRLLEYDDDGQITYIKSSPRGYPEQYLDYDYGFYSSAAQLFNRVLEYVDRLQGSQLADYAPYLLFGMFTSVSTENTYEYTSLEMDYDAQGDIATWKFYRHPTSGVSGVPILETEYSYGYEYDEYGRISTAYRTGYDDDDNIEETCVSYYEYE